MGTPDVEIEVGLDGKEANAQIKKINKNLAKMKNAATQAAKAFAAFGNDVPKQYNKTTKSNEELIKSFERTKTVTKDLNKGFLGLGSTFASVTKAFAAFTLVSASLRLLTESIKAPITSILEFETALVAVGKTASLSGDDLNDLGSAFQNLSRSIPLSTTELLEIGRVAGQLGITGRKDITKFTEVLAKLQSATDGGVIGEEGARQIARLLKLTNTSVKDVDRFSSSLVELGNKFETSENAILSSATTLASATTQFDLTGQEVLALATSLKSLGQPAEISASSIGKALIKIKEAISSGGVQLENFAEVSRTTSGELVKAFSEKPLKGLNLFLKGLRDSDDAIADLKKVGLGDIRVLRVLPTLAKNYDTLTRSLDESNDAYEENTALNKEAARAFSTTESKAKLVRNTFNILATNIGKRLNPAMKELLEFVNNVGTALNNAFKVDDTANKKLQTLNNTIGEVDRRLIQTKSDLEDVNAELAKNPNGFLSSVNRRSVTKYTSTIEVLEERLKKLREQRTLLKEQGAVLTEEDIPEQDTSSSGGTGEKALRASFDIRKAFQEAQRINDKAHLDATITAVQVADTALFETLNVGLGEQETLRVLAQVNEIKANADKLKTKEEREKEHLKALNVLRTAEAKAQDNIVKEEEKREKLKIANRRSALGTISTLSRSSNKELAAIGKAAGIAQIAIDTPVAVSKAFAAFPPPFNFIAAAGVAAAMASQAAQIASVNTGGFQNGGIIPGNSLSGDRLTANVNSGEMILNKQQQTELFNQANGASSGGGQQEIVVNTSIELDGEIIGKAVSKQVADGLVLGEVV